ncbi:MAG: GMC oxidoreductase, partial [Candidatus Rokuibacteriota bacterium]
LSTQERHPDGLGNAGGQVGRHLTFHHLWAGRLRYVEPLYPGRLGPYTGQSHQFRDPPGRGRHGGLKVEFSSHLTLGPPIPFQRLRTGAQILEALDPIKHWRVIKLHAESVPDPQKWVALSAQRDRFGDPFAHVHYESADFDHQTYQFAREVFDRFVASTGAAEAGLDEERFFTSASHHMGTCRMGRGVRDSVVDSHGRVHGIANLFVLGGSTFPGTSAVNPTLTMTALAIRAADRILDQLA